MSSTAPIIHRECSGPRKVLNFDLSFYCLATHSDLHTSLSRRPSDPNRNCKTLRTALAGCPPPLQLCIENVVDREKFLTSTFLSSFLRENLQVKTLSLYHTNRNCKNAADGPCGMSSTAPIIYRGEAFETFRPNLCVFFRQKFAERM